MATSGCLTRNNAYLFVFPSTSTEGTALLLLGEDRSASPAGMKSLYLALHERGSANSVAMASPGSGTSGSAASVADRRSCLFLLTASLVGANAGIFTATEAAGAAEAAGASAPRVPSTSNVDFKPRDIEFPSIFLGTWRVSTVLTKIDLPFGPDAVPDMRQVKRAEQEDLNVRRESTMRFVRSGDAIVMDRKYNTASLIADYVPGMSIQAAMDRIQWSTSNVDHMTINIGSTLITSDITRRMQQSPAPDALTTIEFYQQFVDDSTRPKLKASRASTKWRWREVDGTREIIATQTVADFADPADGTSKAPLQAIGSPVVIYNYRIFLTAV